MSAHAHEYRQCESLWEELVGAKRILTALGSLQLYSEVTQELCHCEVYKQIQSVQCTGYERLKQSPASSTWKRNCFCAKFWLKLGNVFSLYTSIILTPDHWWGLAILSRKKWWGVVPVIKLSQSTWQWQTAGNYSFVITMRVHDLSKVTHQIYIRTWRTSLKADYVPELRAWSSELENSTLFVRGVNLEFGFCWVIQLINISLHQKTGTVDLPCGRSHVSLQIFFQKRNFRFLWGARGAPVYWQGLPKRPTGHPAAWPREDWPCRGEVSYRSEGGRLATPHPKLDSVWHGRKWILTSFGRGVVKESTVWRQSGNMEAVQVQSFFVGWFARPLLSDDLCFYLFGVGVTVFIWGEKEDPRRWARQDLSIGTHIYLFIYLLKSENASFYTKFSMRKTDPDLSQFCPNCASKAIILHRWDYNSPGEVTQEPEEGKQPGGKFPEEKRQTQSVVDCFHLKNFLL